VPFGVLIPPFWLSGEIGAHGEAGLRYQISMNRCGVFGDVHPFVDSNLYGEGGVSVVVGGAGVRAEMTLLNAELGLWGSAQLTWLIDWLVINKIYCDYQLEMLGGKLIGYVYVYVPKIGVSPWEKKEYTHKFWGQPGFKDSGELIDDQQYIALKF
jgi:hypothetical protein